VHGKALGRTVGKPTANLKVEKDVVLPPGGVYATVGIIDGKRYKAVTNVGTRPSVDNDQHVTIETFFLELNQDLYGKKLTLEFLGFIRPTKKFADLSQVSDQIQKDIEVAYSIF
jgi:riboflavin kinase/FMN adenylyltransferase